ncbi:uncharacterized protein GBIM_01630 [Gryllus bimaculatus]|nr:uncharacterized protein GBIM_01630 [Gryllus bimaculatus]
MNPLDEACREHGIAYHNYKEGEARERADEALTKAAWERVKSRDASFGERAAALGVAGEMKLKFQIGGRVKNKTTASRIVRRRKVDDETNTKRSNIDLKTLRALEKAKKSLRGKTPRPPPPSPPPAPPRPETVEERLKTEVEKARENIRNRMNILQESETLRNRLLDTYLTASVSTALTQREKKKKIPISLEPSTHLPIKSETKEDVEEAEDDGDVFHPSFETLPDSGEESDVRTQHYEELLSHLNDAKIGLGNTVYGPHYIGGQPHIGHSVMELYPEEGLFSVQGYKFYPEPGLLELLFSKRPNLADVTTDDKNNYKKNSRIKFRTQEEVQSEHAV